MAFLTIPDVAAQVLDNTVVASLSDATERQATALIRAINKGVAEWFSHAPDSWKRTTISHHFSPQETISGIQISHGNTTVDSGTPFTADHRGKTIKLDGDGVVWNEVVSTTSLLKPYLGDTTPTDGTLYHDAIVFRDYSIVRIVNSPRCDQTGQHLIPIHPEDGPGSSMGFTGVQGGIYWRRDPWTQRSVGQYPTFYKIDYVGNSSVDESDDAQFLLRVDPMPTVDCTVSFEADFRPRVWTIADLHEATKLPVDTTLSHLLLPLIEKRLTRSSIWDPARDKRDAWEEAREAVQMMIKDVPARFSVPRRRVRVKPGW